MVQLDISLGNAIEIVSILGMGTALLWRAAGLTFELKEVRKDLEALKPHGATVPLIAQRVDRIEEEHETMRKRQHQLGNDLQYIMARVDDALGPREPSRPDLTVEDPRRTPQRR